MIKSMTGYGSGSYEGINHKLSIEIKTLNSKFLDLSFKLPKALQEYELEVKSLITEGLVRGKVNVVIDYIDNKKDEAKFSINTALFDQYLAQAKAAGSSLQVSDDTLFRQVIQMPEVIQQIDETDEQKMSLDDVLNTFNKAIDACNQFREKEGQTLFGNFVSYIKAIGAGLEEVIKRDPERIKNIKDRIEKNLAEMVGKDKVDQNRFEQELIYYIEKLDIAEEKVRLRSHLDFFLELLESPESNGKKLGFITQEIGREINTIGSKANDAAVQRHVVDMKEELEKIKEQLLNIL